MSAVHFDSYTEARAHLKELLDAAANGQAATIRRDTSTAAVVDSERLRHFLAGTRALQAQVVSEAGGWSIFLPGVPVAADGPDFDDAIDEMVMALREYAEDWQDRLRATPNHRENWGLVQLIELSSDELLREWLIGAAE
ncbi:prevent-host-death protein [Saccharopolyspora spinosa]|uniref:Antitoxin of RelE/RelB toxin-antitoxin system n=1 Tax=Saccharopolyspora spinosa TaxID=60894 RepID=A0A2N3XWM6_SACSN|nr:prevent-host-death protein [Saccharopolyspora spinosa]PKW15075.1 antitoxin of RelE/RelB toxin-antitoxin system [Saccharopolyspora spinosa]